MQRKNTFNTAFKVNIKIWCLQMYSGPLSYNAYLDVDFANSNGTFGRNCHFCEFVLTDCALAPAACTK